ncbi:transglycosylase SLT domain-containing protein [Roseomonas sp. CCTCC AB2023176]|uniref:transglycosylase SLT domain-containing protein n=1 Tax=Roseomonas sp. CCTCC AB2023176 TaxID=3342640 RepID=UPI0035E22AA6
MTSWPRALLLAVAGCAPAPPPDPLRPPTPAMWDGRHPQAHLWSAALLRILTADGRRLLALRPTDMPAFCPRYDTLPEPGRAAVWLMLFSAIAEKESGFRPAHTYREAFRGEDGRPVISRGLLQTSFESTRHHGCDHRTPADTHDPIRNLQCGVRIMTWHLEREPRIGGTAEVPASGGARYWAVLRPGHRERPLEIIQANTANHPLCR